MKEMDIFETKRRERDQKEKQKKPTHKFQGAEKIVFWCSGQAPKEGAAPKKRGNGIQAHDK
jgi:hypothetical protein